MLLFLADKYVAPGPRILPSFGEVPVDGPEGVEKAGLEASLADKETDVNLAEREKHEMIEAKNISASVFTFSESRKSVMMLWYSSTVQRSG